MVLPLNGLVPDIAGAEMAVAGEPEAPAGLAAAVPHPAINPPIDNIANQVTPFFRMLILLLFVIVFVRRVDTITDIG